jgi:hypothetical protein
VQRHADVDRGSWFEVELAIESQIVTVVAIVFVSAPMIVAARA